MKNRGPDKFDTERKKCANTLPRVRKQTHFFETSVCIDYENFLRSFLC